MSRRIVLGACLGALMIVVAAPASPGAPLRRAAGDLTARGGKALVVHAGVERGASSAATFTDAVGDAGQAIDIASIEVSNTGDGQIEIVLFADIGTLDPLDLVQVFLDTDNNPATGNTSPGFEGVEYAIQVDADGAAGAPAIDLFVWNGSTFVSTPQTTLEGEIFTDAIAMRVNSTEVGNTTEFNFWMATIYPDDPANPNPTFDFAPETGTFNYPFEVDTTPPPAVNALKAECDKPCDAGDRIELRLRYTQLEDETEEIVRIFKSTSSGAIKTISSGLKPNPPGTGFYSFFWNAPKNPKGWYKFCGSSADAAGNESKRDCAKIIFPRIGTDAQVLRHQSSAGMTIDRLWLPGLPKKTTVDIDCTRGCGIHEKDTASGSFNSKNFKGKFIPNGAIIVVRVTHARWVGHHEKLTVGGPTGLSDVIRCMAPGTKKPTKRCS